MEDVKRKIKEIKDKGILDLKKRNFFKKGALGLAGVGGIIAFSELTKAWRILGFGDGTSQSTVASGKNLLINGAMTVNQRGSQTGVTMGAAFYMTDRWRMEPSGTESSVVDITQATDVPSTGEFGYSLKVDVTTAEPAPGAAEMVHIHQRIEAQNLLHLKWGTSNAKNLTLQFWIKSPKSGTHCVTLLHGEANDAFIREFTIASADTWEFFTVSFPGNTSTAINNDTGNGLEVIFPLVEGSNFHSTANSWLGTADYSTSNQQNLLDNTANDFFITGVQLEVGTAATPFEHEDIGTTLAKCQRYYQLWGDPKEAAASGTAALTGVCRSTSSAQLNFGMFNVEMRAAPTMTWSTVNVIDSSASGVDGTVSGGVAARTGVTASVSSSGLTDGNGIVCEIKAGGSFQASAEL